MTKTEQYAQLIPQIKALIEKQTNVVGALCNVTALLKEAFDYYFWVGFYIVKDQSLQLGPFQGSVACYTIAKGKAFVAPHGIVKRPSLSTMLSSLKGILPARLYLVQRL